MVDYEKSLCIDCLHIGVCKHIQQIDEATNTIEVKVMVSECNRYIQCTKLRECKKGA